MPLSNRNSARLLPIFMLAILCLSFIALADDDEHESRLRDENLTSDQIALRDSVYGFINKAYTQRFKSLMQPCCYDCHSDQTNYPWYHLIPGIGGMIDGHIEEAREHLDLSNDFPFAGYESQTKALEEIKEEIEEGEMPLLSYRMLHWGSTIDGDERDSLFAWADAAIGWEEYLDWRIFPPQYVMIREAPDGAIMIDEHGRMWWYRRRATPENLPKLMPVDTIDQNAELRVPKSSAVIDVLLSMSKPRNLHVVAHVHPGAHYSMFDTLLEACSRVKPVGDSIIADSLGVEVDSLEKWQRAKPRLSYLHWRPNDDRVLAEAMKDAGNPPPVHGKLPEEQTIQYRLDDTYWFTVLSAKAFELFVPNVVAPKIGIPRPLPLEEE